MDSVYVIGTTPRGYRNDTVTARTTMSVDSSRGCESCICEGRGQRGAMSQGRSQTDLSESTGLTACLS